MFLQKSCAIIDASYSRRTLIGILGLMAAAACGSAAYAQPTYPNKPIRIIVGFAAGGPTDIIARVIGSKIGEVLGQQVYIENRAGASGNIASETVARATPDGYTILLATLPNAVNESLYKNFKYPFSEHFVPIGLVAQTSNVLVVHPSIQANTVSELIALAKTKPGDILYATAGKATATHFAAELFNMMAGVKMMPVHYKGGGETIKDLVSGEVKVMFSTIPPVLGFVRDGSLRGLGTTGLKRDAALPDLPTIAEAGVNGYSLTLWFGLAAPAGTPRDVVEKISGALKQALNSSDTQAALAKQGYEPLGGTPEEFATFMRSEIEKWAKLVPVIGTIGD
jgi:tripartite-type tricarboxylate transporter receptor subunit TctC